MFTLKRDRTVDTTISNLVMCGALWPRDIAKYMVILMALSEDDLARQLAASKMLLGGHYKQLAIVIRN